jgi:integrase
VALPDWLAAELAAHLATDNGEYVFTSPNGGPLRRGNFRGRVWRPATARAGLEGLRWHDLRHTHVAFLIAAGVQVKAIQSRLGHSSIKTTLDTYGHLFEGLDEAAAGPSRRRIFADSRGLLAFRTSRNSPANNQNLQ